MAEVRITGDVRISGKLTPNEFTPPAGSVGDAAIASDADVAASKLEHQHRQVYGLAASAAVATAGATGGQTYCVHVVDGAAGTIKEFKAVAISPPSTDGAISVDLLKATQGGTAATVLSAPVQISTDEAAYEVVAGSIGTTALALNDTLWIRLSQTTHTGCTHCLGVSAILDVYEDA